MMPRADSGSSATTGAPLDAVDHGCRLGPVESLDDGRPRGGDAVLEQDDKGAEHAAGHRHARGTLGEREGQPDGPGNEQDDGDHVERHAGDHRAAVIGECGDLLRPLSDSVGWTRVAAITASESPR